MTLTRDAARTGSAVTAAAPSAGSAVAPPAALVRFSRALAATCLLALVVLGLAWELRLAPTGSGTLALKVLPLVFGLPGVLRYRMATYRWLSLLVWLYVTEGLVRATSETGLARPLAAAEVLLASTLFVACVLHIRTRLRRRDR
jgi:uncharacterized membrane protein